VLPNHHSSPLWFIAGLLEGDGAGRRTVAERRRCLPLEASALPLFCPYDMDADYELGSPELMT